MLTLKEATELLSSVFEPSQAEKMAQVLLLTVERLHEGLVAERLEALERAFQEQRKETDLRFREMIEAQRRTDERLERLTERVEQLTEAQRRTEQRVEELAEAQRRTEQRVDELAEAQRRTDERLAELAEAQRRTQEELSEYRKETDRRFQQLADALRQTREELSEYRKETDRRFQQLADALRQTQEALATLAETVKDLQKQVGGLSQTVGYVLENEAMKRLPELLLRDYGLQVDGRLKRQYVQDTNGRHIEVNVFGTAKRNGETVTIIGESKSQLSKNDIDRFLRRTIGALEGAYPRILPVLITHMTSEPDAEEYARSRGVALYFSYEF